MKSPFKREPTPNQRQINAVYARMLVLGPDHGDYDALLKKLKQLEKIETIKRSNRPSSDTVLLVLGNLAGILAILTYEQAHVLVSKAFANVLKVKT